MRPIHVFFDFDDTLLDGDSILFWLRFYYRHRPLRRVFLILNWIGLLLFSLRIIRGVALKRIYLMPMAYEKAEELDRLARAFVEDDLARRFHLPVLQRLLVHHALGHRIVIISASATFYLRHLRTLLPMAEVLGTEMEWPRNGWWRFPRYRDGNLRGENKIVRLHSLGFTAGQSLSFAYSDHHHDAFLLRFAEFPICVRPTRRLRELAREEGWPVWDWPRNVAAWRDSLGRLALLLFAAGRDPRSGRLAAGSGYVETHLSALRERVAVKYSETIDPESFRTLFPSDSVSSSG